jgi:phage-related holin
MMFFVIVCDLIAGIRKSWLLEEKIKFSTAVRRTIAKMLTYFSFIIMVILIDFATASEYNIAKWAILFICVVEGGSIISNILKPHGYDIDFKKIVNLFVKKIFRIENADEYVTSSPPTPLQNGEGGRKGKNTEGLKDGETS